MQAVLSLNGFEYMLKISITCESPIIKTLKESSWIIKKTECQDFLSN